MSYITDLKPHIGAEKTLVISGGGSEIEGKYASVDNVFLYNIPQGMLFRYDPHQHEMLVHHVCEKRCSQIIYVAPSEPSFLEYLENIDAPGSVHMALKFHLSVLLREHEDSVIRPYIKHQMLLEIFAIEQCKLLMEYFFIGKKIDQGNLKLKGLVPQANSGIFKSVFLNGISYNDLLTLN
jgi:hypothetical protein